MVKHNIQIYDKQPLWRRILFYVCDCMILLLVLAGLYYWALPVIFCHPDPTISASHVVPASKYDHQPVVYQPYAANNRLVVDK